MLCFGLSLTRRFQRYQEASQHILDALALQETDSVREPTDNDDKRGVTTSALWDSLKTCCLHLRRLDLATICDRRDLDGKGILILTMSAWLTSSTTYSIPTELSIICMIALYLCCIYYIPHIYHPCTSLTSA